jgi:hypothetical protein
MVSTPSVTPSRIFDMAKIRTQNMVLLIGPDNSEKSRIAKTIIWHQQSVPLIVVMHSPAHAPDKNIVTYQDFCIGIEYSPEALGQVIKERRKHTRSVLVIDDCYPGSGPGDNGEAYMDHIMFSFRKMDMLLIITLHSLDQMHPKMHEQARFIFYLPGAAFPKFAAPSEDDLAVLVIDNDTGGPIENCGYSWFPDHFDDDSHPYIPTTKDLRKICVKNICIWQIYPLML